MTFASAAKLLLRDIPRLAIGLILLLCIGINCANIVGRYVFLAPLDWAEEVLSFLIIWGVCLGASLHIQKHQSAALQFAQAHRAELSACPSLFFSVSLSAASKIPDERLAAERLAADLPRKAGWQPSRIASVAGRLAYTRYGFVTRWFMRRIARKEGASDDVTRDHEYTDWAQVAALANELADAIRAREATTLALKSA